MPPCARDARPCRLGRGLTSRQRFRGVGLDPCWVRGATSRAEDQPFAWPDSMARTSPTGASRTDDASDNVQASAHLWPSAEAATGWIHTLPL
jgi:hypothetical protein